LWLFGYCSKQHSGSGPDGTDTVDLILDAGMKGNALKPRTLYAIREGLGELTVVESGPKRRDHRADALEHLELRRRAGALLSRSLATHAQGVAGETFAPRRGLTASDSGITKQIHLT
jgi:hypothetical protein